MNFKTVYQVILFCLHSGDMERQLLITSVCFEHSIMLSIELATGGLLRSKTPPP